MMIEKRDRKNPGYRLVTALAVAILLGLAAPLQAQELPRDR